MDRKTQTWLELAGDDLEFASEILAGGRRPHYVAHFCHQAIEKLLKAVVQYKKNVTPLPTHNFKVLCQQAGLQLPAGRNKWLFNLAPHYLGARYPEDLFNLQKQYTKEFSRKTLKETEEFFEWLKINYLK